jgi:hypothetical protein
MNADKRNLTVDALTGTANDDWNGLVNVKVQASDSVSPPVESNQFTINVTPANDAPVWGVLPNLNLQEDVNNSQVMDLAPYVTDVDNPPSTLTFAVASYTNNQFMDLYINGHFLGINPKAGVDNFYGTIVASILVADGTDDSLATLNIIISGTNDGPFVNHTIGTVTFEEDTIDTTIDLSYIFADPENDQLTYGSLANPNITASINNMGHVALAPGPNWNGEADITFFANDTKEQAVFTVHVVVTPVNDVPVLSQINPQSLNEGLGVYLR